MRRAARTIYSGITGIRGRWMWLMRKAMLTRSVPELATPSSSPSTSFVPDGEQQRGGSSDREVATGPSNSARDGQMSKFDCTCCGVSPAEVPYEANCTHIYCYSCIHHITRGFTVKNRRQLGLIRSAAAGSEEAEEKRRDRAIGDPFRNSLGLGSTEFGGDPRVDSGHALQQEGLVASSSTGAFIGVDEQPASISEGQLDEAEEEELVYLCPICDTIVEAGERFSLD